MYNNLDVLLEDWLFMSFGVHCGEILGLDGSGLCGQSEVYCSTSSQSNVDPPSLDNEPFGEIIPSSEKDQPTCGLAQ